ncbi:putative elongation factor selb [Haemophilus haemolyticus M19107]|nr:putative elongation factor selb [Haemophilus haemolyticus M19107]
MTIDLGYAYLPLENKVLGFIDVPGHEKFLSNMLAGLGGVNYAMLIVASDEGIAAQTKEHLAILRQLQFHEIIVVITKADRTNPEQIESLIQTIKQDYSFFTRCQLFHYLSRNGARN